jgi:hypothetical protein
VCAFGKRPFPAPRAERRRGWVRDVAVGAAGAAARVSCVLARWVWPGRAARCGWSRAVGRAGAALRVWLGALAGERGQEPLAGTRAVGVAGAAG